MYVLTYVVFVVVVVVAAAAAASIVCVYVCAHDVLK